MIVLTTKQAEYARHLLCGPKTTRDFALHFMVTVTSVAKILAKLRNAGLINSSQKQGIGNVHLHKLTPLYHESEILIRDNNYGMGVSDAEIHYAAKLRNEGLTGQRLTTAFNKVYPDRATSSVLRVVVRKAKEQHLCR